MLKAKVKMIDFGFARYLKKEELAYSTLGSPINMDPGILRKLNKMAHSNEYGYDEKADIWSLGTICYEMLIGKCTFDAESMKELVTKVEKGDYFIPNFLSKEAVSFLNGMLQYDFKKRLTAEQLYRHKFINKKYKDLNKIDLRELKKKNIKGSKIKVNSKVNQSIWDVFGNGQCSVILEEYPGDDSSFEENPNTKGKKGGKENEVPPEDPPLIKRNSTVQEPLNQKALEQEFMKVFEMVNDDFIYIEPKLIPIIPGDDPAVINKVSEFSDDNF